MRFQIYQGKTSNNALGINQNYNTRDHRIDQSGLSKIQTSPCEQKQITKVDNCSLY